MLSNVQICDLTEQHRPALEAMIALCGAETQKRFSPINNFYTERGPHYYLNFRADDGHVYVATINGDVLGLCYFYQSESERIANFGILVADPYQRQGIGTRMMTWLEEKADARGYRVLRTGGGTRLDGGLRPLLLKRGYVECGHFGSGILMEKRLVE